MMRRWIIAIFVCSQAVMGQNAKVAGIVRDKGTLEPLPSANVVIRGTAMGAAADIDGKFFILNIPPGTYDVTASIIGYQSMTLQNVIVHAGRTTSLDFDLRETTIEL